MFALATGTVRGGVEVRTSKAGKPKRGPNLKDYLAAAKPPEPDADVKCMHAETNANAD